MRGERAAPGPGDLSGPHVDGNITSVAETAAS